MYTINSIDTNRLYSDIYRNSNLRTGISEEAYTVQGQLQLTAEHWVSAYSQQSQLQRFYNLTATWQDDAMNKSAISEIVMTSEYQEIIGMGINIVPLILMELKNKPDHWFWALNAITRQNPVKPEHRGIIKLMIEDWLQWGKENGFIKY